MRPEERNQFAERWLDDALAHYCDAEPRSGLESRIMASLEAPKSARNPLSWRLWVPVACTAAVAVAIGIASLRITNSAPHAVFNPPAPTAVVHSVVPDELAPTPVAQPARRRLRSRKTLAVENAEPRQPRFPADTTLTEQQRLLLAYVNSTPLEELARLSAEQREWRELVESGARSTEARDPEPGPDVNQQTAPPLESGTPNSALGAR